MTQDSTLKIERDRWDYCSSVRWSNYSKAKDFVADDSQIIRMVDADTNQGIISYPDRTAYQAARVMAQSEGVTALPFTLDDPMLAKQFFQPLVGLLHALVRDCDHPYYVLADRVGILQIEVELADTLFLLNVYLQMPNCDATLLPVGQPVCKLEIGPKSNYMHFKTAQGWLGHVTPNGQALENFTMFDPREIAHAMLKYLTNDSHKVWYEAKLTEGSMRAAGLKAMPFIG